MIYDARHAERIDGICRCGKPVERRDVKVYCSTRCKKRAHRLRGAGVVLLLEEGVCPVDGVRFEQPSEQPTTCSPECAEEARKDTTYWRFRQETRLPRNRWRRWLAGQLHCAADLPQLEDVAVALAGADKLNVYVNASGKVVEAGMPR